MTKLDKNKGLWYSVSTLINRVGKNKKRKGNKMSSKTKTNIKVVSLVTGIFAYVIGAVIVDLPSLTWSDVVSLSYFGIGGGLLFWLIGKTTK